MPVKLLRLFFSKTGEAAYISHLDLQRVMGRALRRSRLPVWYSQGFNPHIYLSFALPLSLGHQSVCEVVDCKSETEETDFGAFVRPLNDALPRGIRVEAIGEAQHNAKEIARAEYVFGYPVEAAELAGVLAAYVALPRAPATRRTKRSETEVDLKPEVEMLGMQDADNLPCGPPVRQATGKPYACFAARLPAGGENTWNPELLVRFLQHRFALPEEVFLLRRRILMRNGEAFF